VVVPTPTCEYMLNVEDMNNKSIFFIGCPLILLSLIKLKLKYFKLF